MLEDAEEDDEEEDEEEPLEEDEVMERMGPVMGMLCEICGRLMPGIDGLTTMDETTTGVPKRRARPVRIELRILV